MDTPIDRKYNLENLKLIAPRLSGLEYCVFFGTLLGCHREGNLLEMDDDVDIFINSEHRSQVLDILTDLGFDIRLNTDIFVQGCVEREGVMSYVDFYLYRKSEEHAVDEWNFGGLNGEVLHVPLDILFPTVKANVGDICINMPKDADSCCRFLYGDNYRTPLRKNAEYTTRIVDHKPVITIKKDHGNGLE